MLPWIVLTIMLCIGLVISIIYTSIDFLIHEFYFTSGVVLVVGLLCTCKSEIVVIARTYNNRVLHFTGVYVFMWWVTYSYYQKIKEEDNRTPYTRTPYYG